MEEIKFNPIESQWMCRCIWDDIQALSHETKLCMVCSTCGNGNNMAASLELKAISPVLWSLILNDSRKFTIPCTNTDIAGIGRMIDEALLIQINEDSPPRMIRCHNDLTIYRLQQWIWKWNGVPINPKLQWFANVFPDLTFQTPITLLDTFEI